MNVAMEASLREQLQVLIAGLPDGDVQVGPLVDELGAQGMLMLVRRRPPTVSGASRAPETGGAGIPPPGDERKRPTSLRFVRSRPAHRLRALFMRARPSVATGPSGRVGGRRVARLDVPRSRTSRRETHRGTHDRDAHARG